MIHAIVQCSRDVSWALKHGSGFRSRWRLCRDFALSRLMCAIPLNEDVDRRVRLADGTFLVYRLNRADIWAIHEIYVDREYDLPPDESPKVIIDLGANIGLASLWFAKKFKAFLLAVEPSAENARVARRNFIENDLQGEVIEAAVGSTDGTGVFLRGPGATCGRVDFKEEFDSAGRKREHAVDVRVVSMVSILERLPRGSRVDLLKVDIEGGEEELLRGDTAWLHRVDRIIIEFHPDLIDYLPAVAKLESAGFVRRKQTNLAHTSVEMFSRFAVYTNDATQAEGEPDFKSGQK